MFRRLFARHAPAAARIEDARFGGQPFGKGLNRAGAGAGFRQDQIIRGGHADEFAGDDLQPFGRDIVFDQIVRQQRDAQPGHGGLGDHGKILIGVAVQQAVRRDADLGHPFRPAVGLAHLVQQRKFDDVGRRLDGAPGIQFRTANRDDVLVHQILRNRAGPVRRAVEHRGVERLQRGVDRRLPRRDMNHDFRIHPLEIRQTGNQPARGKCRQRDEIQGRAVGKRRHALRRVGKVVQRLLDLRQIHLACVGQYDALADALEQANAEMDFELANLPADRALGQIELVGGARKTAVLSRRDKRRQFADRRNFTPFQRTRTPDVTPTSCPRGMLRCRAEAIHRFRKTELLTFGHNT